MTSRKFHFCSLSSICTFTWLVNSFGFLAVNMLNEVYWNWIWIPTRASHSLIFFIFYDINPNTCTYCICCSYMCLNLLVQMDFCHNRKNCTYNFGTLDCNLKLNDKRWNTTLNDDLIIIQYSPLPVTWPKGIYNVLIKDRYSVDVKVYNTSKLHNS